MKICGCTKCGAPVVDYGGTHRKHTRILCDDCKHLNYSYTANEDGSLNRYIHYGNVKTPEDRIIGLEHEVKRLNLRLRKTGVK